MNTVLNKINFYDFYDLMISSLLEQQKMKNVVEMIRIVLYQLEEFL